MHVVGLEGVLVEVDRDALRRRGDDDGLHRRADLAAHERFGDAVAFDDLALPCGGAAAVAAHRRHDERLGPEPAARGRTIALMIDRDVGDAAAADGDGDGLARADRGAAG